MKQFSSIHSIHVKKNEKERTPYLLPASCMDIKVEFQTARVISQCNGLMRGTVSVGEKIMSIMAM